MANSYYPHLKGSQLRDAVYSQFRNQLEPEFKKAIKEGFNDVTFIHCSKFEGDIHATSHGHFFICTSSEKEDCAFLLQEDPVQMIELPDSVRAIDPAIAVPLSFVMKYLKKNDWETCYVGEPSDLKFVLKEGHLKVPPSAFAQEIMNPLTRKISNLFHQIPTFLSREGQKRRHEVLHH